MNEVSHEPDSSDEVTEETIAREAHALSKYLEDYVSYSWEARRELFSKLFILEAVRQNQYPSAVSELKAKLRGSGITLPRLINNLLDIYLEDEELKSALQSFYKGRPAWPVKKKWKVPKDLRTLPSVFWELSHDVEFFASRLCSLKENYRQLKDKRNHIVAQRSGPQRLKRKKAKRIKTADEEPIRIVKHDKFSAIFQRTRELFFYRKEALHFYHAAAVIEVMHDIVKAKHKSGSPRDEETCKAEAESLATLCDIFITALRNAQGWCNMDEMIRFLTGTAKLREALYVRDDACERFKTMEKTIRDEEYILVPIEPSTRNLGSLVYGLRNTKAELYDKVYYWNQRVRIMLEEVKLCSNHNGSSTEAVHDSVRAENDQSFDAGPARRLSPTEENDECNSIAGRGTGRENASLGATSGSGDNAGPLDNPSISEYARQDIYNRSSREDIVNSLEASSLDTTEREVLQLQPERDTAAVVTAADSFQSFRDLNVSDKILYEIFAANLVEGQDSPNDGTEQ